MQCVVLVQKKKIAAVGLQRKKICSSSLQGKKKLQQQVFFTTEKRQPDNLFFGVYFWGIFLQKGFLIQIRFRGQFSGEIFINLS